MTNTRCYECAIPQSLRQSNTHLAQREPVFIESDRQEVSARHYNCLSGKATRDFLEFCDKMAAEATARELTEEKFEQLLN